MESVEQDRERIVLPQLDDVVAHLVGNPLARRRRIEAASAHIEVVLVEHHPDFRALTSGGALIRYLLNEVRNRLQGLVYRLVEPAVQANWLREPRGAHGGAALLVSGDDFGGHRSRRKNLLSLRAGAEYEGEAERET